jgi:hypothetical protein
MLSLLSERRCVNSVDLVRIFEQSMAVVWQAITGRVNLLLSEDIDVLLGRRSYERRERVPLWIESGVCARCGSTPEI